MKKFLTVLLALSVVFTYTFAGVGSVFAAAPSTAEKDAFNATVDSVERIITRTFNTNYETAVESLTGDADVSTDNWKEAAPLYKTAQLKAISERAAEIKTKYAADADGFATTAEDVTALFGEEKADSTANNFKSEKVNAYESAANVETGIKNDPVTSLKAAELALTEAKNDIMAIVNVLDLSMYSKNVQTLTKKDGTTIKTSYYDVADERVEGLVAYVSAREVEAGDDAAKVITKINQVKSINQWFTGNAYQGYTLSDYAKRDCDPVLKTIEEEGGTAATLEAQKAAKLAAVQAKAAKVLEDTINTRDDYSTVVVPTVDAYVLAQKYLIDSAKNVTELNAFVGTPSTHSVLTSNILANVNEIAELESVAAKYKLLKDDNGNLLKDADLIDDVVTDAKLVAYRINAAAYDNTADIAEIKNGCNVSEAKTTYAVEAKKAELEDAREAALCDANGDDKYYAPEAEKVNALYDELIAKVDAAKTNTEIADIDASDIASKVNQIKTKTAVKNAIKTYPAFNADNAELDAYKEYLNATTPEYSKGYRDFSNYDTDYFADFYAEKGVRANADITADILPAAKAVLDGVKSNGDIATAKASVEAKIDALPKTAAITAADKAAIEEAWNAVEEYKDAYGRDDISNKDKLTAAVNQVLAAEKYAANKIYNALPAKLTVADKDAVQEYKAALEAIVATEMYDIDPTTDADVAKAKTALETIRDLEKKAVEDAINALPLNITMADKAAVEAAKTAYDEFVKEYTVYADTPYEDAYNAANEVGNARELALAEATIAALETKDADSLKVAIKGTHVKINSKAGKGYIKISWDQKDNGVKLDGYEVYRSTKKTSGFKKISTFKVQKSKKYTKGMKKGTKYYFYVKGYKMVGDKKVYAHKSITVYRTFR